MFARKKVSVRQIELLVEFLETHRDLAFNRLKNKEASAMSSRLWTKCAKILNADPDGDQRTPKQWNKWYTDYKCRLLQRVRQVQQYQNGGGGSITTLTPLEERIATLLGASCEVVGISEAPMKPEDNNILIYVDDIGTQNHISESEPESNASSTPAHIPPRQRNPHRHRSDSQGLSSSELKRLQNQVTSLEKSRIEVERQMATGFNKMAEAVDKMADAASRSADALCKIAEALGKFGQAVENRGEKWRIVFSSEEDE